MTDQELQPINPNTANEEALVQLAGVGPKMAAKIISGRPYAGPEDLLLVPRLEEDGATSPALARPENQRLHARTRSFSFSVQSISRPTRR